MTERVYFDHNASSPLRDVAREAIIGALDAHNPSSAHAEGRRARQILEEARESLARVVGCDRDEVVFTSGGTESNTWAVHATPLGTRFATTRIEHPSITALAVQRDDTAWLEVASDGTWRRPPSEVLADRVGLVSVMTANHETGHRLDLRAVVEAARACDVAPLVHTDASQAVGRLPVDMHDVGVTMMTVSAHKLGGPIGIGALCVRSGTEVPALLVGGGQEGGLRGGTEAAALAAGFAAAAQAAEDERTERSTNYISWVEDIWHAMVRWGVDVVRNSPAESERALPNTLNVSFPGRSGVGLVHRCDLEGLAISHGSACASGSLEPSAVLLAFGHEEDHARSALRISLGHTTTQRDVERLITVLERVLKSVAKRNA